jgi:hypothetical protein
LSNHEKDRSSFAAALTLTGCGTAGRAASSAVTAPPATSASASPSATVTLSPDNLDLKVKILEKECFGSAGCNVTYQIKVSSYDGPDDVGDQRFRVVYEVRGGEDGPQVNNMTFTGDSYEYDQEETISTRPHPHLTARVTDVIEEDVSS